ncbi:MAG: hypothetical protein HIU83_13640 [Proteobacteria bacterium]|nr:hypothetical protein [Pseudomonadota bacterium]
MINLLCSGFIMMVLLSGCGWDGTPTRNNDFVPLTSIEIVAVPSTIAAHTSTTLTAKGNFSGIFTRDITDQVTWSSDSPSVAAFATAASPNRVTGLAPGTATLTATVGSVSATFKLTVSSATVTALAISPQTPTIAKGLNTHFTASGTFSDNTTQDLTFDVAWTSSDVTVATVSDDPGNKGIVQAIAAGTSTISATFGAVSGTTLLTVTEPVLQSITVLPANPSVLSLSSTDSFTATGHFSDGTTPDITSQVTWSSSNPAVATIATTGGAATTLSQGTASINATLNDVSGASNLKVTGGNLTSFTISPTATTIVILANNTRVRMTANGTFSNGSIRDITGAVQWTSADPSRASVTAAGGNLEWLTALAATQSTIITATITPFIPFTATLRVTAPQLLSIEFSPTILNLTAGTSSHLTVTAHFGDGTSQDVTSLSTLTSGDTAKATVAAGGFGTERVTGVASGTTTISATYTYNGITFSTQFPVTVMVTTRTLRTLTISPQISSVTAGNQVQFTATAGYSDGTSVDVTADTTWTIDNPNVAILADNVNQPGLVLGVDNGVAKLTASFGGMTPILATTITVTGP